MSIYKGNILCAMLAIMVIHAVRHWGSIDVKYPVASSTSVMKWFVNVQGGFIRKCWRHGPSVREQGILVHSSTKSAESQ